MPDGTIGAVWPAIGLAGNRARTPGLCHTTFTALP